MGNKTKKYEVTKCDCGHKCPLKYIFIKDGVSFCPKCSIKTLENKISNVIERDKRHPIFIQDYQHFTNGQNTFRFTPQKGNESKKILELVPPNTNEKITVHIKN